MGTASLENTYGCVDIEDTMDEEHKEVFGVDVTAWACPVEGIDAFWADAQVKDLLAEFN